MDRLSLDATSRLSNAQSIRGMPRFTIDAKHSAFIEPPTAWNNFSIEPNASWKIYFDLWIAFLAIYSTFTSAYFASYGVPNSDYTVAIDWTIELFFLIDLILNGLTQFQDASNDFAVIRDIRKTFKNYAKKGLIIDLLPLIPFYKFAKTTFGQKSLYWIKMLRLYRLFAVMSEGFIKSFITTYFKARMKRTLEQTKEEFNPRVDNNKIRL